MAHNSGTWRARKAQKAVQAVVRFELGEPPRPKGLEVSTRRAWNKLCTELLAQKKLAKSDGALLLELIQCRADQYKAASERRETARQRVLEIERQFATRKPFEELIQEGGPEKAAPAPSLETFLADCAAARATFSERLVPGQTVLLDAAGEFTWHDADPSTAARHYAQDIVQGATVACDLMHRAASRFLSDLEHGAERGLFFDPAQARHIAVWFATFLGTPLLPWQQFIAVNLFGWRLPSGLRRFRECWAWVARQNGKSSLAAGIGLFGLIADGEPRAQVYSAATKKDQSEIIFKDAKAFLLKSPELQAAVKQFRYSIASTLDDGAFQPLASDVASLDGLRPSVLLADEVHEWDATAGGRDQWAKLTSGQVSRTQPLTIAISTAGGAQRGFAWEKYSMVRKILQGIIDAPDIFCAVWELDENDDHCNQSLWPKSNPSLHLTLKLEALQKQFAETQNDPSSLNGFLRYTCNRWVAFSKQETTFSLARIDACRGYSDTPDASPRQLLELFLAHNYAEPCFAGYDHGETNDLACFALLYPSVKLSSGEVLQKKVVLADFWMPEAMVRQREKEWQMPVSQWVRDGWISVCEGDLNDPRQIKQSILETLNDKHPVNGFPVFNVRSIGYDKWHSRSFMTVLAEECSVECVEVPQIPSTLTPICVALKEAILFGNLWTLGNPVIRWMLNNVILEKQGAHGVVVPTKPAKHQKIDVVQAACCAWQRLENAPPPSPYLNRGIILL